MGVLLCNENKLDEMSTILGHYMGLVPTYEAELHLHLPIGGDVTLDDSRFHKILFGGDQLTVARMRGTKALIPKKLKSLMELFLLSKTGMQGCHS